MLQSPRPGPLYVQVIPDFRITVTLDSAYRKQSFPGRYAFSYYASPDERGVPMVEKPVRSVRVPDGRWNAVKDKAKREGKTTSDVVNEALEEHLQKDAKKRGK